MFVERIDVPEFEGRWLVACNLRPDVLHNDETTNSFVFLDRNQIEGTTTLIYALPDSIKLVPAMQM